MAKKKITAEALAKQAAYTDILNWITKQKDVPADVLNAAKLIRPSYFDISGGTSDGLTPAYRALKALLPGGIAVGESFTLDEAFQTLRYGMKETRRMIRYLIKDPIESTPIVWIKEEGETFVIEAIDNEKPADWSGYTPSAKDFAADEA
jgi:hypothetical protein